MDEPASFFLPDGDRFVSTEWTRGPWSEHFQHGGPPSALLARACEHRLAAEPGAGPSFVARLLVEFLRPVPIAPLTVETEVVRPGRKVRGVSATLRAGNDVVMRANALAIRTTTLDFSGAVTATDAPPAAPPPPDGLPPVHMHAFFRWERGYHTAMELRLARGDFARGAVAAWMRMAKPLLPNEAPSPLQRVAVAADSGNGVSQVLDPRRFTFVNPDLAIYLHRPLEGEWVCLDARTVATEAGVGLAESTLFDHRGAIGRAAQSLIVEPVPR